MSPDLALNLTMRQFVLGQLDPSARLRLEEQLVTDPAVAQALSLVEQDVSEDYLDDALTPLERRGFEATVLATAAGRQHFDAIQTIREADRVTRRNATPAPVSFAERVRRSFSWEPAMAGAVAAVALLACAASVALFVDRQRLRSDVADAERKAATAEKAITALGASRPVSEDVLRQMQDAAAGLVERPGRAVTASASTATTAARPGPLTASLVALTLQPGAFRGDVSGLRRVVVPEGAIVVRLMLVAPDATAPAYRADVMNSDGERVLSIEKVAVTARGSGRQVTLDVPASVVPPGDYQIELHDAVAGTRLPRYSFRVRGR